MTRREWIALTGTAAVAHAEKKPSIIGDGWGLDHFMIALADPALVKSTYAEKLGFTVLRGAKRPGGHENANILLAPAYIELIFLYDRQKAETSDDRITKRNLSKIDQGGGAIAYNVEVSPIDRAVAQLRDRGMEVELAPRTMLLLDDGTQVRGAWQFLRITKPVQPSPPRGVPGGEGVGFLEYDDREWWKNVPSVPVFSDPRRPSGEAHANTARRIRSVWVAVTSASDAVRHSQAFGFPELGQRKSALLRAKGREVKCGQGSIVFWESTNPRSPLSDFIGKEGLGPFGLSIEVADLRAAREIVRKGVGKQRLIESEGSKQSFVLTPDSTGGIWLEFVQT